MDHSAAEKRIWLIVAAVIALVLIGAAVLLLVLGGAGLSGRYYDTAAPLAAREEGAQPSLAAGEDGRVTLRLNREDLYWYADRFGLLRELSAELMDRGGEAGGFRIAEGKLTLYARCRVLGLFPLSYRASADLRWDDGIRLTPTAVSLGRGLSLGRGRWPALFREDIYLPAEKLSPALVDARLEGDALILTHAGLEAVLPETLRADRSVLEAMRLLGVGTADDDGMTAYLLSLPDERISSEKAMALCRASADPLRTAARLFSFTQTEDLRALWQATDVFTRETLLQALLRSGDEQRRELNAVLADEQARYEKLLSAVRESYKSGALAIAETGFVSAATGQVLDTGALTSLPVTATDCRVLFLYSGTGRGAVCTGDMPAVSRIPRAGKKVMDGLLDEETAYDLGVTLTSGGGVPLLLSRRSDGTFLMRELTQNDYVSLLVADANPVLDVDALPEAAEICPRPAGEGWTGAELLLLGE